MEWERNLSVLATIGNNAPFIGLFGTVLGIIKAFHDLSQQATTGAATVTSGISEALVATAIGLLVAIPAVIAFNLFQRRVKTALAEAESLKSFLVGKIAG
jgi:biopolymer transport protein ExbB